MSNFFLYLSFRSGPDSDVGSVDDLPIDDEDVGSSDKVTTQLSNKSTSKDWKKWYVDWRIIEITDVLLTENWKMTFSRRNHYVIVSVRVGF
jgi:hypothetical protein